MIFIQLDKPVYKNGDTVKFRTFLVDHNLVPIDNQAINVTIYDGNNNEIKKFENIQTSKIGHYQGSLKVADLAHFGTWLIKVDANGRSKAKNFQVLHHDNDNFQVLITPRDKEVALVDKYVLLDIQVKHQNDKIFTGIAKFSATVMDKNTKNVLNKLNLQHVQLPLVKPVVQFSMPDNLGIRFPSSDLIIDFDIEVVEDVTQKSQKLTLSIPMRHKGRNNLSINRDAYFKPGFDYTMTVQINDLNDQPDKSVNSLMMNVDYEDMNPVTNVMTTDKKNYEIKVENGVFEFVLHPKINTKSIKVYLEMAETELAETINSIVGAGVDEYMQIEVLEKKALYDIPKTLQLTARSSNKFESLHMLVFGPNGLIQSKEYPEAQNRQNININLELTEEMTPKCLVLMFYVRQSDGLIIYDQFPVSFKINPKNTLVLAPDQTVKSNQPVNIRFKSSPIGSTVFLSAIDLKYASISTRNEISRMNLYNETIQYMYQKFTDISNYKFNSFNAFVMQPSRSCDDDFVDVPNQVTDDLGTEELAQKYFPDIWFDEVTEVTTNGLQSVPKQLPNDLTSWKIVGLSVHPTTGIAVGTSGRKVIVESEIAIKVRTPALMHDGEVLKLEFSVFNFLAGPQDAEITVNITNGDLMTEKWIKKAKKSKMCKTYVHQYQNRLKFSLRLPASSMSDKQSFFVQPDSLGEMRIKIAATAGSAVDEVEKVIKIDSRRRLRKAIAATYLINSNGTTSTSIDRNTFVPKNLELVNVDAVLSGNMLGPMLEDLEKVISRPMTTPDHTSYRLVTSFTAAKYYRDRGLRIPDHIMNTMSMGYQEALATLQNEQINLNTRLHNNLVIALVVAKTFINIDNVVIEKALDKLKAIQNTDGSFNVEVTGSEKFILTAQIAFAFIQYQQYSNKYSDVIENAVKYLKSTKGQLVDDCEKVTVAYTFAVYGDQESARYLTCSIKNQFRDATRDDNKMSIYVKTVSYLIKLKLDSNETAKSEVEWLLNQRNYDGGFYSKGDTLLAFDALASYAMVNRVQQTSLTFKIENQVENLMDENGLKYMSLPKDNRYIVNVMGTGLGYMTIRYQYFLSAAQKYFTVNVGTRELSNNMLELTINVQLNAKVMNRVDLALISVEMPSGYEYHGINNRQNVQEIEIKNNRTLAIMYVDGIVQSTMKQVVIQAVKVYEIEQSAKSTVEVYDYDRPNIKDEFEYEFVKNTNQC
ncbi:thioester-containing protein 1 allele R1-like [Chironomus tepperi]|uniref:thioester-containing protein 1 allele R1-like n=1 Tax=Chironomus tepperi TaxID=113505 RepID=UPI00391EF2C2